MGAGDAHAIAAALMAAGKPASTPVALVENASLPNARTLYGTLQQLPALAERTAGGPTLILMGEVYRDAVRESRSTVRKSAAL
jgi:siroheme synthase